MHSTRDQILQILLSRQRSTINELAQEVGINPISVRHHVIKMQAEGLVGSDEERHGVGRPRRFYFLTETGAEKFPTRYFRLANRLLDQLKDTLTEASINQLFSQMGESLAEIITKDTDMKALPMEERLRILEELLAREGFQVSWELVEDRYIIKELNCPYYHIGQEHPEVCSVDQTLISNILDSPALKVKCILNGDDYCTYEVNLISTSDINLTNFAE